MADDLPRPASHRLTDPPADRAAGPPADPPADPPVDPPAPDGGRPVGASAGDRRAAAGEGEPDARFTFANERTFLAWHRTALALVVAGLAIVQLLPPFPGIPLGRHLLAVPLIVLGGVLSAGSYWEWVRHQRALRRGEPVGRSVLPALLAAAIVLLAAAAAVLTVLSHDHGA